MQDVPYYPQWESEENAARIVAGAATPADDPLWAQSGADSCAEYARWASHVCGMACLKMILAARTGQLVPTITLAKQAIPYGAYVEEADGTIRGMVYAPFVQFVAEIYGLSARVVTGAVSTDIPALLTGGRLFMASVHPSIRWPETTPPSKGGHLVLVTAADGDGVTFHNPSGHTRAAREHVRLKRHVFDAFFAGRGIVVE